ncbi:hypothetical protein NE865_16632 [Phthorimaea operculella]|nr:hypothetical protein NE865_16632 [Phthorimaea operculella]
MEEEAGEEPAPPSPRSPLTPHSPRGSDRDTLTEYPAPAPAPAPIPAPTTPSRGSLGSKRSAGSRGSRNRGSIRSNADKIEENISEAVSKLVPQGNSISSYVDELTHSVQQIAGKLPHDDPAQLQHDIRNITRMSKILTDEAAALRTSIRGLTQDIRRSRDDICRCEDVNFPYHLFLIEMIVNKIHMKCECFELNSNNLVISATFLGKAPIILYDDSYGPLNDFTKLNVGKSTLFAMTYDKICAINEFEILLQITKEPSCTSCVTKIAETRMDYTKEFLKLREELCRKWSEEKPKDNIICTTSTPLSKSMFYLSCGDKCNIESIGVIEMSVRMSFLGKEINTAFCASPSSKGTSVLKKEDNGISMYSCQKVEMDDQGKILLDEDDYVQKHNSCIPSKRTASPASSRAYSSRSRYNYDTPNNTGGGVQKFDEIYTKMNDNELKIRVPKATRVDKNPRYEKIQELCSCEDMEGGERDAGAEQIQFQLPRELCAPDIKHNTHTANLKYTYKGCDKTCESRDRKLVNVTPANCPISSAVNMEKVVHPQKDVFILKIGKKMETKDKKTDLEIELVTPKVQNDKLISDTATTATTKSRDIAHGGAEADREKEQRSNTHQSQDRSGGKSAIHHTEETQHTTRGSRDMSHGEAKQNRKKDQRHNTRKSSDISDGKAAGHRAEELQNTSQRSQDKSHGKTETNHTEKQYSTRKSRDMSPGYRTKKMRNIKGNNARWRGGKSPTRANIYRIEEPQYIQKSCLNISHEEAAKYCKEQSRYVTQRSCAVGETGAPVCFSSAAVTSCDAPAAPPCAMSTAATRACLLACPPFDNMQVNSCTQ